MSPGFPDAVPPYPGWKQRLYRLSRPVTMDDIAALLGGEEDYIRETPAGPVHIIQKFGLVELHCLAGEPVIGVWFDPENAAYPAEYLDALLATRF